MMGILVTKDGEKITDTLELVQGTCQIDGVERAVDGSLDINWCGETRLDWDGQKTVERNGQRVFLDESGNEHLENELHLVEADDSGEPIIWRNTYECSCGEEWTDDYSCQVDDDCPVCDTTCSPSESASLIETVDA